TPARVKSRQDAVNPAPRAPARLSQDLSAQLVRNVECLADGTPDFLHVLAVCECLVHGTPAERRHYMVGSHARRIRLAELRAHPLPERCEPHPRQATGSRGGPGTLAGSAVQRGQADLRTAGTGSTVRGGRQSGCRTWMSKEPAPIWRQP